MKIKLISSLVFALVVLSSCEKRVLKENSSISYGTFFSMCTGYCQKQLVITDQQGAFTQRENGVGAKAKTCERVLSDNEVSKIKELLDNSKIKDLPETIGCPDCADGGGEWIEIKEDGKTKRVTFEYNKAPAELAEVVERLRAMADGFKDCK